MRSRIFSALSVLGVWLVFANAGRAEFTATNKTLYVVATAHLDDQWNWTILDTINSYIPATLQGNFALFQKYPHYTFTFEESYRYKLVKEYYPADFLTLSNYIAAGRWRIAGSSIVAGDVLVTSPESLIRQSLYSGRYWQQTFGVTPVDLFLPDCFGFPSSLPSIAAHCGLKGFSTQKLQAKTPMIPIPLQNIGRWIGVDGNSVVAALQPGSYHTTLTGNLATNAARVANINALGAASGVYVDYMYFGLGDVGGAPDENSVKWLEQSITNGGSDVKVVSTGSEQLFRDLTPSEINQLPAYEGELLMKNHGAGCYTAHSEMKRYLRLNEQRAAAAEQAAVIADWLQGGGTYPQDRLNSTWDRFLWHTFHDDLTGTSIDAAYNFSWNDELIALNELGAIEQHGVGMFAKALDTTAQGVPLVVFNPLAIEREDVVEAKVVFTNGVPAAVKVYDADGNEVPSQAGSPVGNALPITFVARVPSAGAAVFDVRPAGSPSSLNTGLSVTTSQLENARYRVQLNANGDVSSILDKANNRELLKAPIRWGATYDLSTSYPAWEILYSAVTGVPTYLGGTPSIQILENGPARVSLGVTRFNGSSTFTERIRLAAGGGGDRLEWNVSANWGTRQTLLKVAFPLTVTNTLATYDLGLGTMQRSNNTANSYEVPAQQWADLTHADNSYGVTIMNDCKYGWDKPDGSTLRLTIFHTPDPGSSGYGSYQKNNDIGCHELTFALAAHTNDWRAGQSPWAAARLNQPLRAFQTSAHAGALGKRLSFLSCNNPNVMVKAVKKAEASDEIIVRLQELTGQSQSAQIACGNGILSAREVNGVEAPIGALTVIGGVVPVSLGGYRPMTVALTIASNNIVTKPICVPVSLPFNLDAVSTDANRANGNFDAGYTYPAELFPSNLVWGGINFQLGPTSDGATNALACQGQTISLPTGYDQLFLLAAAASNDVTAPFTINGVSTNLTIGYFSGFIGQWNPPLLKPSEIAWVCTHRHTSAGNNDAYRFCYLFKYNLALPPGTTSVTLPNAPGVRIFAMSVANQSSANTVRATESLAEGGRPWVDAGTNQTITLNGAMSTNVTLTGSATSPNGGIVSFAWAENGVTLATNNQAVIALTAGNHMIVLTVTDSRGVTAQDAVSINVGVNPVYSGSGVWTNRAGGDWLFGTNWSGGNVAYGLGSTADFSTLPLSSNLVVSLGADWRIGNLSFADQSAPKHGWTLLASGGVTLDLNGGAMPQILANTPVTLDLPLTGTNGFRKAGDDSLTLLGASSFPSGQAVIAGGVLNLSGDSSFNGSGNFNVTNGVLNIDTTSTVAMGNYVELGGTLNDTIAAGVGVINQSAGTANIGGSGIYLEVGVGTNAYGLYQLADGALNTVNSSGIRLGASGIGVWNQTGGTLDCARYFAVGSATGGASAGGGRGVATFTGGTASLGSASYRVILGDKANSRAVLNIGTAAGGDAFVRAASSSSGNWGVEFLDVAGATMSASLNLNSGTLQTVGPLWRGSANTTGAAYLNFNGGILQAGANQAAFIPANLTRAAVFAGGAIIDSGPFQITNAAAMVNAPGKGIYPAGGSFAVTNGGSGYRGAPLVTVSGGSGSNAMAVAQITDGVISSVTMTCPGENYQAGNTITFTFTGGGATASAGVFNYLLKPTDVANNATGGFTKLGPGTLTTIATNTLDGTTAVQQGTLNIVGQLTGNGNVSVGGGTLAGVGLINQPVMIQNGGILSPGGGAIGALTISNSLVFQSGANCRMDLNKAAATNDLLRGLTQITFGGTLTLSNFGGSLVANDSFKLFDAASYQGDFTTLVPAIPAVGLAWNTSRLKTEGRVDVRGVNTQSTNIGAALVGQTLRLTWPLDRTGWRLQMQSASAAVGLSGNWVEVAGASNTNVMEFPVDGASPCRFYRLVYP